MKCALVTGGSRGIGRAICTKLVDMGYYVLINYKSNTQEANNTLSQVKQSGGNRFGLPEEVSHVVGFLASKEASYMTAEVLSINGGLYS